MSARSALVAPFTASDPGRARLTVASAVTAGVLASALVADLVVNTFHANVALLPMATFLSVQAGSTVKDRTAMGRVVTAALLLPTVVLTTAAAAVLLPYHPADIPVFVAVTGLAVWARRFGPRGAAIGSLGFMSYFFTLFIRPTAAELPVFCLIAACAIVSQLAVRAILLCTRPRRQVTVLLRELRSASASALRATSHPATLRARLARIDGVGRALTAWQQSFRAEHHISCTDQSLDALVLDARIDTEEACYELAKAASPGGRPRSAALQQARTQLLTVLDEHASAARIGNATTWAERVLAGDDHGPKEALAIHLMARDTIAHARVRGIDLTRGLGHDTHAQLTSEPHSSKSRATQPLDARWIPWNQWAPTSRMAIQAMVAASIASMVGEAISASRWYWAVMTAFIIFAGVTTRSGILTRAFRRVTGTAVGIIMGIGAVVLADHQTSVLIMICAVSVFGMLYFGPLNYVYSSLFMTTILVAIYSMLGVLNQDILELRVVETLAGAVIGVLSAYLILTTNSRPALTAKVNAYFDALDHLLGTASAALTSADHNDDLFAALNTLESAQADLDQTLSAMATAFLITGPRHESEAVHLMYIVSRSAARLAQSVADRSKSAARRDQRDDLRRSVDEAIGDVTRSAAAARQFFNPSSGSTELPAVQATVLSNMDEPHAAFGSPEAAAIMALSRMDWALRRISDNGGAGGRYP